MLTANDLYEFAYRADTAQKIATAERWLSEHESIMSRSLYDELIAILAATSKRLFRARLAEYEAKLYNSNILA